LAFEIEENAFEISLVEDLFLLSDAQEQGTAADVVDLAGDPLGVVIDAGDKAVAEELILIACDTEMVFDVASSLLQVEGFEVVAVGDALVEGFIGSETELVSQVRLAKEDETAFARQVREGSAELREKAEEAESGFSLKLEEDLAVEGDDGEDWKGKRGYRRCGRGCGA